jgi:phospholipid/cholesterol/gamma-HCH transport system substrate-binding protein
MVTKAQKFRLGIFISVFSVLLIGLITMVVGNKLTQRQDTYHIRYKDTSVSGLKIGGAVNYHGISIGRVERIDIDREDIQQVIVTISVNEGTPIKQDVLATLAPVGITGLMQIELIGGTNEAAMLSPGETITAGKSTLANLSGKAEIIADKVELVLNNLIEITNAENQHKLGNILANVDTLLAQNKEPINNTLTNLDSLTFYLAGVARYTEDITNRINTILASGTIDSILANSSKVSGDLAAVDLTALMNDLNKTILEAQSTIQDIDITVLNSRQDVWDTIDSLKETIEYLNEFSRMISEDPTLLLRARRK